MDFKLLLQRAIDIRNKYSVFEKQKTGKEWTNLNLMEGFVGDVGDLMKLVMAKEGVREIPDVDQKLAHELSDCLWSVLVLANKYNVDLETSFLQTMDELEKRIESELKE
ncbi:nucleotide pyrophosphohydrolase [Candidatus Roizmanbacteria bacterium CG10_big_fil_rev_8_21_14_0_10_39_6]|uniref:Nucleotide pyrophosphohydrolase n=1 Tax=Candidatus Roizmanbacteria bacterium CG10_big_fil_rev_8_21_14_0_10_39_6 TaxID=1974853 RepID=A0A2M8KTB1_9BACT|nr:MAG: nucleotide pyrophosphohydrolase [Candidatus Roizmanbacteria bacterium CG10_big_fil_rev_8_21_14_0_10_39_6]